MFRLNKILRPSSLDRYIKCSASGLYEDNFKHVETIKGLDLHDNLESYINGYISYDELDDSLKPLTEAFTGTVKSEYVIVYKTPEFSITGVADVIIIDTENDILSVYDVKTGNGDHKPNSIQNIAYGFMASQSLGSFSLIELGYYSTIHKRLYTKTYTYSELNEMFNTLIAEKLPNSIFYKTGDHCKYCSFNTKCEAFMNDIDMIVSGSHDMPIKEQYSIIESACKIKDKLISHIKEKLSNGDNVDGFKLFSRKTKVPTISNEEAYNIYGLDAFKLNVSKLDDSQIAYKHSKYIRKVK